MKNNGKQLWSACIVVMLCGLLCPSVACADVVKMKTKAMSITIKIRGKDYYRDLIYVDWGDGISERYDPIGYEEVKHTYGDDTEEKTITITSKGLTGLSCDYNHQLSTLDASGCTSLKDLRFEDGNLSILDVSGCTSLTNLYCRDNQLSALSVSGCTSLKSMYCTDNKLSTLDVSGCTSLTYLECYGNQLSTLDVSGCTSLTYLECYGNQLSALDVSGCTSLTSLNCRNNQLSTLGVSGCTSLTSLNCRNNQLNSLNASGLTSLTELNCSDNQLGSLDASGCTSLRELNCSNNQLYNLNVSGCTVLPSTAISGLTSLTTLICHDNGWTSLDIGRCKSLSNLNCSNNQLNTLNVNDLVTLTSLNCNHNQLSILDVSGLTSLTSLDCSSNQLNSLDASGLASLTSLNCSANQLNSLDASGLVSLMDLNCSANQLNFFDVSGLTSLTDLDCSSNQLKSLDVRGLTSLSVLSCDNNPLRTLNASGCTALPSTAISGLTSLTTLVCHDNGWTSLDVRGLTSLTSLDCSSNQLNSLNVSGLTSLADLDCTNNPLSSLNVSGLVSLTNLNVSGCPSLTSLDVSGLASLMKLNCSNNNFVSLDNIKLNSTLQYLDCSNNRLTTLDLSKQSELIYLACAHNEIADLKIHKDAELLEIAAQNNRLLLSTLAVLLGQRHDRISATLSPQRVSKSLSVGDWDLREEMLIAGTPTAWTLTDEVGQPVSEAVCVEKDGVFRFRQRGNYVLTLRNPRLTDYASGVAGEPASVIWDLKVTGMDIAVYTVTVEAKPAAGGALSVSDGGFFEYGQEATVTATPSEWYAFVHWMDASGNVKSTANPYTFPITSDVTLTAVFEKTVETYNLDLKASAGGTVSQSGSGVYEAGSEVTVTATASSGYEFLHWTDASGNVKSTANPYTFPITSDVTLTAVFEKIETVKTYRLELRTSVGGMVSQSGSGVYEAGSEVTVTATASSGYEFLHWTDASGNVKSTANPYTFPITSDVTLTAVFEKIETVKTYRLELRTSVGGTVSQSGSGVYEAGTEVTITATSVSGFRFVNWERVEEKTVFTTKPVHTFRIEADLSLIANFVPEKPGDTTAVEKELAGTAVSVYAKDRTIYVMENTAEVGVYTLGGLCVYRGCAEAVPVRQSGVYVVWVGERRFKVLVP